MTRGMCPITVPNASEDAVVCSQLERRVPGAGPAVSAQPVAHYMPGRFRLVPPTAPRLEALMTRRIAVHNRVHSHSERNQCVVVTPCALARDCEVQIICDPGLISCSSIVGILPW